jgi:hypothetical protein
MDRQALAKFGVKTISVVEGDKLHHGVLAENVTVIKNDVSNFLRVEFDFLCPNCGKRHWATEYDGGELFQTVGWTLTCGWVGVRMPWTFTPARDRKSIYGSLK